MTLYEIYACQWSDNYLIQYIVKILVHKKVTSDELCQSSVVCVLMAICYRQQDRNYKLVLTPDL